MSPDPDLVVIMLSLVASVIGGPIAWALARRINRQAPSVPPAAVSASVEQRLAHIEQAVDAIAVEMERVSEGQRFTTRLLSERGGASSTAPDDRAR